MPVVWQPGVKGRWQGGSSFQMLPDCVPHPECRDMQVSGRPHERLWTCLDGSLAHLCALHQLDNLQGRATAGAGREAVTKTGLPRCSCWIVGPRLLLPMHCSLPTLHPHASHDCASTHLGKGRVLAHTGRPHEQHAAAVHRACNVGADLTFLKCDSAVLARTYTFATALYGWNTR